MLLGPMSLRPGLSAEMLNVTWANFLLGQKFLASLLGVSWGSLGGLPGVSRGSRGGLLGVSLGVSRGSPGGWGPEGWSPEGWGFEGWGAQTLKKWGPEGWSPEGWGPEGWGLSWVWAVLGAKKIGLTDIFLFFCLDLVKKKLA